jgi:hypothetical protein
MHIWIDGDACPKLVKDFLFKAALRLHAPTTLIANRPVFVPRSPPVTAADGSRAPLIGIAVVGGSIDEADRAILTRAAGGDLVVTADIPLAAALVDRGVVVIDPRGTVFTHDNVKEALATRNLMHDLREGGLQQGGPAALGPKDAARFANAFDREVTRLRRLSR